MSKEKQQAKQELKLEAKLEAKLEPEQPTLSLDWWSVLVALAAVLAVKSGLGPNIPW